MTRETLLAHHLSYNHYPPVSVDFVPVAVEAIDACDSEDYEKEISMPNGKVLKAHEIVEGLHLDDFVGAES